MWGLFLKQNQFYREKKMKLDGGEGKDLIMIEIFDIDI